MGFILKNTSALISTKLTDVGRQKLSEGNFNITYFQIGDSEVLYNKLPVTYNTSNTMVLEPGFNAHNASGVPDSNKQNVKYPYYVDGVGGNTYGIPNMESVISPIYNTAAMRGFFSADTTSLPTNWSALVSTGYCYTSNFIVDMSSLNGTDVITISANTCNVNQIVDPAIGDLVTIYYDLITGNCTDNQFMSMSSCYPILTYRVLDYCDGVLTLDRNAPDFTNITFNNVYSRLIVYPSQMTDLYDSNTPLNHYSNDIINFESVCSTDEFDVKIWNMNIPWSETLAGIDSSIYKDYEEFGSVDYLGAKEYLGYMSNSGQTFFIDSNLPNETTDTYYYDSFGTKVSVEPEEQKGIGIIHYTNQTIDLFYGEKFALEPYDTTNPGATGQARNFRLHLPWLMWHKNPECCMGETFWVDPPGFSNLGLATVRYMQSNKNDDMNTPGLRYYQLWDTNPNPDGYPNRVGKVFPDDRMIVIDDEELLATMSYKSNRNWTLPAPKVFLSTPNTCNSFGSSQGVLTGSNETMFVTYRFSNSSAFTNSLHCNYYVKIEGPNNICNPSDSENVGVRFGGDFPCLTGYSNTYTNGFFGEKIEILCQKVPTGQRPNSDDWRIIDMTSVVSANTVNGYITKDVLTGATFVITKDLYDAAATPTYNLDDYITISTLGNTGVQLNFGDEYYFYGALETDIQATIYEMVCKVNLSNTQFLTPSNPTWNTTTKPYLTEIGLYDYNKNLMIVSKLQSPVPRQGIQQFVIKLDF